MKYPRPTYGIEAGSGGPAGAPITPVSDPSASPTVPATPTAAPADWRTGLPDELRASPALTDVTDVNSLAQQFVDQQRFMGDALRVPGPDAGAEDRQAFHARLLEKVPGLMPTPDPSDPDNMDTVYNAMGRPAQADQYQRPTAEGIPPLDEHLDRVYTESAHRNGLSQAQYHNIMADFTAGQADMQAQHQAAQEVQNAELKQEWGYTHDTRMTAIQNTLTKFGFSEGVVGAAGGGGLGKQDAQAFYKMVEALGGENEIGQQPGGAPAGMTPAEAEAQIQEIMAKPEYLHHDMSVRKPWMDKIQGLLKYANPDAPSGPEAVQQMRRSS